MSDLTTIISLLTEIRDRLPASVVPAGLPSAATVQPSVQPPLVWIVDEDGGYVVTPNLLDSSAMWYTTDGCGYVCYWDKGGWDRLVLTEEAESAKEEVEAIYRHADANGIVVPDHPDYPRRKKRTAVETMLHVAARHALLPSFDGYLKADTMKVVATASFTGIEVKNDGLRVSSVGRGEDFEKAAADCLGKIAGKLVVAYGPTGRREFIIPKEDCNV